MPTSQSSEIVSAARAWTPRTDDWRAWHIFFGSTGILDRMLIDGVQPEVRSLGGSVGFFFLRYWENGPHIRARFRGLSDDRFTALGERLRRVAESIAASSPAAPEQPPAALMGNEQFRPGVIQFAPGKTVEILYEPEYRRYGGRHGLALNEHLFDASSRLALSIIEKTIDIPDRRTPIALALTATAIGHVVRDSDGFASFLNAMKDQWRSFVPDHEASEEQARRVFSSAPDTIRAMIPIASARNSSLPPSPLSEQWRRILVLHFSELRALAADGLLVHPLTGVPVENPGELELALQNIMLSQIHMLNNRLGILPQQEFVLASTLALALSTLS